MSRKIIVAKNYRDGKNKAEELDVYHAVRQDKAIIVCTDDSFGACKLKGLLFTLDDVVWVGPWYAGKYAKRIKDEIHIRHWQALHYGASRGGGTKSSLVDEAKKGKL